MWEKVLRIFKESTQDFFLLTKEQQESYENAKICCICKEKFENKYLKDKKYRKSRDHCHYTGKYGVVAHTTCNLKYKVPKKVPIDFRNGSNYDYRFIIKELAEEFNKQFIYLGENTDTYITFKVSIEKEVTRSDKNGEEVTKIYLPNFNLLIAQDLLQINANKDPMIKNAKLVELHTKYATDFLNAQTLKMI